jgi:hypothetical protein
MAIIFCTWFFAGREIPKNRAENKKIIGKHAK